MTIDDVKNVLLSFVLASIIFGSGYITAVLLPRIEERTAEMSLSFRGITNKAVNLFRFLKSKIKR